MILHFLKFFQYVFNFFRFLFFGILIRAGLQDTTKTSSRRPQEPPRRLQEPPRRSKMPPRHSCGRRKSLDVPRVLQGFRCPGPAWSMASKTTSRAPGTCSTASKTPSGISQTAPKASKTPPRASKMLPRHVPRSPKIENFIMLFNLLAFLGLLGGSSLNMVVKTLPR